MNCISIMHLHQGSFHTDFGEASYILFKHHLTVEDFSEFRTIRKVEKVFAASRPSYGRSLGD